MSRLASPPSSSGDHADLTPLIDVIFLLLLFFIITTTFAEDAFFTTTVPRAQSVTELRTLGNSAMVDIILVDGTTRYQIQAGQTVPQQVADQHALAQMLTKMKAETGLKAVIVRTQEERTTQYLIWALDALKAAGISEYSLTTRD